MQKRNKPDYSRKSALLEGGLPQMLNSLERKIYKAGKSNDIETLEASQDEKAFFRELIGEDDFKECERINHARFERTSRLHKKISSMIDTMVFDDESHVQFLTLTFRDDVLASTSEKTRRTYVSRYLKDNCSRYVANIDYGEENGREHYHAVVLYSDKVNYTDWNKYGIINGERVQKTDDGKALSRYTSKLTNHAIKKTASRCSMIYSRQTASHIDDEPYNPYQIKATT